MSEVRGNHLFTAEIADSGPMAATRLARFLGGLDSRYRSMRWLISRHEAALSPLEDYSQSGIAMTEEQLDALQGAISAIWDELADPGPQPVGDTLPPMYRYGRSVHEMMEEEDYGLTIAWLEMRSPLKVGFLNVVVSAIILAAIFSGGTVNCGLMSVTLPPLGQGIAALREALKPLGGDRAPAPRIRDHIQM